MKTTMIGLTVAALLVPAVALGQATYFTKATLLKDFFARSERVTYSEHELDREQLRELKRALGYAPKARWTIYRGLKKGTVQGYAIIDDERGQHEPITFGVLISPEGRMERLEILVYREAYGDQIRQKRFRRQFVGKRAGDSLRAGVDVDAISGATISSRAMTVGVKRALAVFDVIMHRPPAEQAEAR